MTYKLGEIITENKSKCPLCLVYLDKQHLHGTICVTKQIL